MTLKQKNNLIAEIVAMLEKSIVVDEENPKPQVSVAQSQLPEMLTVKECSQVISGLSEHTVRQWVAQGLIPYIRTGKGKRGKILISKSALLKFLDSAA
ncbi:MAG: helix-turn-helix domain-containing protein [Oscillospiraceae bacterium]|nr:helix-turn-helix domain-containing protein [Oscillospiraceae bacterium]